MAEDARNRYLGAFNPFMDTLGHLTKGLEKVKEVNILFSPKYHFLSITFLHMLLQLTTLTILNFITLLPLQVLPENAHELVNNKLFISVTRCTTSKENVLLSRFESRQELIQVIRLSEFLIHLSKNQLIKLLH